MGRRHAAEFALALAVLVAGCGAPGGAGTVSVTPAPVPTTDASTPTATGTPPLDPPAFEVVNRLEAPFRVTITVVEGNTSAVLINYLDGGSRLWFVPRTTPISLGFISPDDRVLDVAPVGREVAVVRRRVAPNASRTIRLPRPSLGAAVLVEFRDVSTIGRAGNATIERVALAAVRLARCGERGRVDGMVFRIEGTAGVTSILRCSFE